MVRWVVLIIFFCHFKYSDSNKKCLFSSYAFTVSVSPPGKNDCNHTNHNNCKILPDLLDRNACAKTSYLLILRVLCSSGQKGPRFIKAKVLNGEHGLLCSLQRCCPQCTMLVNLCTCFSARKPWLNWLIVYRWLYLVLAQEEGQEHQHASIVDDPPHVDVTLGEALSIGWEGRDVLWDEQGQVSCGGFPHQLWVQRKVELEAVRGSCTSQDGLWEPPTNKVPPSLVLVSLLPVARPGHQDGVMFQAS